MKSTTAFALVASFIPFAVASPYHMLQHAERDADADAANVQIDWITDVAVVTAYTEVTQYWTGEPATTETTTATSTAETSAVYQKQGHHAGFSHTASNSFFFTETVTSTPEPTTTSTPEPTSTSTTSTYVAPEPTTTSSTSTYQAPVVWTAPTTPVWTPTTTSIPVITQAPSAGDPTAMPYMVWPSSLTGPYQYASPAAGPYVITSSGSVMTATAPASSVSGSDAYNSANGNLQAAILASTNQWRWQFGVFPLAWNNSLEAAAKVNADACNFKHDSVGQNIAEGYSSPAAANDAWANEYKDWIFSSGDAKNGTDTGHFTQVVWNNTQTIGCAAASCGSSGWYLVCNYYNIGNFQIGDRDPNINSTNSYWLNVYEKQH